MSNFKSIAWNDLHDDFKDPEFAYRFGRYEREIEIIKLLEENTGCGYEHYESEKCFCDAIALIKGENK